MRYVKAETIVPGDSPEIQCSPPNLRVALNDENYCYSTVFISYMLILICIYYLHMHISFWVYGHKQ